MPNPIMCCVAVLRCNAVHLTCAKNFLCQPSQVAAILSSLAAEHAAANHHLDVMYNVSVMFGVQPVRGFGSDTLMESGMNASWRNDIPELTRLH